MNKFYKIIRIITVAPVLASIMIIIVWKCCNGIFPTVWHLIYSLFFLGILPLLAYPLQKYIPGYKDKGREGQRSCLRRFRSGSPFYLFQAVYRGTGRYNFGCSRIYCKH